MGLFPNLQISIVPHCRPPIKSAREGSKLEAKSYRLKASYKILPRQLLHFAGKLEFEQRGEYFGG